IFESFPPRRYLTAKNEDSQKAQGWSNKITQYALELDLRMTSKRSIDEMLEVNETVEASGSK
ncbi:14761_t:CDS:1, partial [Gigaspora rosea]